VARVSAGLFQTSSTCTPETLCSASVRLHLGHNYSSLRDALSISEPDKAHSHWLCTVRSGWPRESVDGALAAGCDTVPLRTFMILEGCQWQAPAGSASTAYESRVLRPSRPVSEPISLSCFGPRSLGRVQLRHSPERTVPDPRAVSCRSRSALSRGL